METGALVSLDEEGYRLTAALNDNEAMASFIRRVLCDFDGKIVANEATLAGFTPWYSGAQAVQSFGRLVEELRAPKLSGMSRPMTNNEIGEQASLSETGYQKVASLKDNESMSKFIRRVIRANNGQILSEPMLSGFIPWYSGISATQSFTRLVEELYEDKLSGIYELATGDQFTISGMRLTASKGWNVGATFTISDLADNSFSISSSYGGGSASYTASNITFQNGQVATKLGGMVTWASTCSADISGKWRPPRSVVAWAGPYHIHLSWEDAATAESYTSAVSNGVNLYHVYSSASARGPFEKMTTKKPISVCTFCDYLGPVPQPRFYYITSAAAEGKLESDASDIVTASTTGDAGIDDDDAFLDFIQRAHIEYFRGFAEPSSGATRESHRPLKTSGEAEAEHPMHVAGLVTIGGTGLGVANLVVGAARGFVQRAEACRRLLRLLDFLEKADRFHGFWPHWLWGPTGKVQPFSALDDGADLVESCFLFQSLLIARAFFDSEDAWETDLRERSSRLWEAAEFNHFVKDGRLMWHWSPTHAFKLGLAIVGFNEAQICYLLAACHPKYPIQPEVYASGWANGNGSSYQASMRHAKTPLFWTHLSYYGFDPKHGDQFCENYFDMLANRTQAHIDHAEANPKACPDYGACKLWGFSACFTGNGYQICSPSNDTGDVAPFAACSAFPFKPQDSLACMKHMYRSYAADLWGACGFKDSIYPGTATVCQLYVGLDQSTVATMIENGRTGLLWALFMSTDEAKRMIVNLNLSS